MIRGSATSEGRYDDPSRAKGTSLSAEHSGKDLIFRAVTWSSVMSEGLRILANRERRSGGKSSAVHGRPGRGSYFGNVIGVASGGGLRSFSGSGPFSPAPVLYIVSYETTTAPYHQSCPWIFFFWFHEEIFPRTKIPSPLVVDSCQILCVTRLGSIRSLIRMEQVNNGLLSRQERCLRGCLLPPTWSLSNFTSST